MKQTFLILTTLALIALSACVNKEEEEKKAAAATAAAEAAALDSIRAEFLNTAGSFEYDVLTNIETNAGEDFMMYELLATTVVEVEYGEHTIEVELPDAYVVKKIPGNNAFFKGNYRINTWSPAPSGYGVEYHTWPGKVVTTNLLMTYADNKLVRGGIYDGWLRIESIAHLREVMEPGKKVELRGNLPSHYVHVYEYEGVTKGALESRHLLFDDEVR